MKKTDVWIGDHTISPSRLKRIDYSFISDCTNRVAFLGVEKTFNQYKFKLFSVFDTKVWLLLLISLIFMSILNTKFNNHRTKFSTVIISFINHLEVLISKSGKIIKWIF